MLRPLLHDLAWPADLKVEADRPHSRDLVKSGVVEANLGAAAYSISYWLRGTRTFDFAHVATSNGGVLVSHCCGCKEGFKCRIGEATGDSASVHRSLLCALQLL